MFFVGDCWELLLLQRVRMIPQFPKILGQPKRRTLSGMKQPILRIGMS